MLVPSLEGTWTSGARCGEEGLGRARRSCSVLVRSLPGPGDAEARVDVLAGPGCPGSQQEGAATSTGGRGGGLDYITFTNSEN